MIPGNKKLLINHWIPGLCTEAEKIQKLKISIFQQLFINKSCRDHQCEKKLFNAFSDQRTMDRHTAE